MRTWRYSLSVACLLVAVALLFSGCGKPSESPSPITLLYTNDTHAYIDNDTQEQEPGLSFAQLASLKKT